MFRKVMEDLLSVEAKFNKFVSLVLRIFCKCGVEKKLSSLKLLLVRTKNGLEENNTISLFLVRFFIFGDAMGTAAAHQYIDLFN